MKIFKNYNISLKAKIVNNILFIGAVNMHNAPLGGEEYKNQLMVRLLSKAYTIRLIDTHGWKHRPSVIIQLISLLFFKRWDRIILSASSKSVYQLVKIISYLPYISKKTIYFVVGGYFPKAVLAGTFSIEPYNKLRGIVVQGESLKAALLNAGYSGNIHVLPNFKQFPKSLDKREHKNQEFKFLFLSRIHPDKGIPEIIEAHKLILESGINNFSITFYGFIEPTYEKSFLSSLNGTLVYSGVLDIMNDTDRAYRILSDFDAMLFPTYWKGEGFPGVLIDAFVAGVPVIATDWNMNREVIEHEKNGLLIPPNNAVELANAMRRLMGDRVLCKSLAVCAKEHADNYDIDKVWPKIVQIIETP